MSILKPPFSSQFEYYGKSKEPELFCVEPRKKYHFECVFFSLAINLETVANFVEKRHESVGFFLQNFIPKQMVHFWLTASVCPLHTEIVFAA